MKKIYILLCIIFLFYENKAQHTLTAAFNPVVGDIESYINIDTAGLSLGNSGPSQIWNYTGISTGTNVSGSYTYVAMTSVLNNSLYPTGTIARRIGVGGYDMIYGNTSSKIEYLGWAQPTASNCSVYGDPGIYYSLPFTYGSSSVDTYSSTSESGTIITIGDGTGTLQLPSGSYSNILKITLSYNNGAIPSVENRFYSALSKFPLLTISSATVGASIYKGGQINTLVSTSIKESEFHSAFSVLPNPITNGELFLKSENGKQVKNIEIINSLGQVVLHESSGEMNGIDAKRIDVSNLSKGIYYLTARTSDGACTKKIIIE